MPCKHAIITNVSTILTSLLLLAVAMPNAHDGAVHAAEIAHHQNDDSEQARDSSLVLPGQLVRIAEVNAASCESKPQAVDLKALNAAIMAQIVHLARLEAGLQGQEEITLPGGLQSQQNAEPVADALRDEQLAFAARKEALASQVASLNQDKAFSEREIELTTAKETSLERQKTLTQKEFDKIGSLLNEGLVANQQKLTLQQNILQADANDLDVKLAVLRAQREVSKIDRNISDLRNQWRNDSLADFNKTRSILADLSQQAHVASSADPAAQGKTESNCRETKESFYVIVRGPSGSMQAFPVAPKNSTSASDGQRIALAVPNGQ
jgi:hypothetical protein